MGALSPLPARPEVSSGSEEAQGVPEAGGRGKGKGLDMWAQVNLSLVPQP